KVYGSKAVSDKREARGWAGLWPQIAWSFALVFGLAAAVTMMLPRSGPSPLTLRLVKSESAKETAVPARSLDGNLPAQNQPASGRDERESDRVQRLATGQTKEAESQVATPARPAELSTEVAAGGPNSSKSNVPVMDSPLPLLHRNLLPARLLPPGNPRRSSG